MTEQVVDKIDNLVINAAWGFGKIDLEGTEHAFLVMIHPTHGRMFFHISRADLGKMSEIAAQMSDGTKPSGLIIPKH